MISHQLSLGVFNFVLLLAGLASQAHLASETLATEPNRIQQENTKPGSIDWQLTRPAE